MTTLASPAPTRASSTALRPTRGRRVCRWIEANLVHGEGDLQGRPFRLTADERRLIYRLYELDEHGGRQHTRALVGRAKGNGKTELAAAIGCYELAGGDTPSPNIPVGAASFEQADLAFGAARFMLTEGPLARFVNAYDTEIQLKDRPGRMYRVAAVAGTNDGGRPTFFLADELHEWTGSRERVHLVIANGLAKRRGAWNLNITTAGSDLESLCGRMYLHGQRVAAGQTVDPGFCFDWIEAPEDVDLADEDARRAAVLASNPGAEIFWPVDGVLARYHQIPEFEWRRYHLNQWTRAEDSWLPPGAWQQCEDLARDLNPELPCWVGVDIALRHDSTAVVVVQPQGDGDNRRFVVRSRVWRPEGNRIDMGAIEAHLRDLHRHLDVREVAYDPAYFERSAQDLLDEGVPMVEFPQSLQRMVPACQLAYEQIVAGRIVHPGDPTLTDHVESAAQRMGERGWTLSKGRSKRKIDACIAMILALHRAHQPAEEAPTGWILGPDD